jgi:hypothetical protein
MITHRPCGACHALVPADTGCEHWRPRQALSQTVGARLKRERKQSGHQSGRQPDSRRASAAERAAQVEDFRAELQRAGYFR